MAAKDKLEDEIDALFRLPLAEFTGARNTLASRLKQERRTNDAERVKLLSKPPISAWTVNQLYWNHREAFDQLIATGKRFGPARVARKAAGMRDSLDARREILIELSDLATAVLREAGHNPGQDTIRRIVTTLEAMSAYALLPGGPTPGRLTQDLDPPSFDSLASLMSAPAKIEEADIVPARKSASKATDNVRRLEEFRKAKITAAKISLQDAKKSLADARSRAQNLEAAQKKAQAEVKETEKLRREAEQRLEKATAASEEAARRAQGIAHELGEVAKTAEEAKRAVDKATKELESLLRESPRTTG
ncbi:MAG TPA: hypothetical protein VFR78_14400 [Pyrinomonadaceae bacterium]|nr:hypothetical protein [Pyrinomonadaceae bacterium]